MQPVPSRRPVVAPATALRCVRGFTIAELIVVFVVLGVLVGVAVVSFRQPLRNSDDQLAIATLDQVLTTELAFAARHGVYTGWPADLETPSDVTAVTAPSPGATTASVALASDGAVAVAVRSGTGRCFAAVLAPPADPAPVLRAPADFPLDTPCAGAAAFGAATTALADPSLAPARSVTTPGSRLQAP